MPNFRHIRPFMPSLDHPKGFVVHLGSLTTSPEPKKSKLSKNETTSSGTHPTYKCPNSRNS